MLELFLVNTCTVLLLFGTPIFRVLTRAPAIASPNIRGRGSNGSRSNSVRSHQVAVHPRSTSHLSNKSHSAQMQLKVTRESSLKDELFKDQQIAELTRANFELAQA